MKYIPKWKTVELSNQDTDNYISIEGRDKFLTYLNGRTGKGGNSFVFQLNDFNDEEYPQIIKICKYHITDQNQSPFIKKRIERFDREILALLKTEELEKNDFLVKIIEKGTIEIQDNRSKDYTFKFFTMEKADYDLATYLSGNPLTLDMKIHLCFQLIEAFNKLHDIGIYHRDIKPDNIFFIDGIWKIGDLGLMKMRDEDYDIDEYTEKIGPYGFLSPEALNKALGNRMLEDFTFDCDIDDKSDVFQIGKVLWYIIQGEVPSGQLMTEDFKETKILNFFETVIKPSLQFAKNRRPNFFELKESIIPTCKELRIL